MERDAATKSADETEAFTVRQPTGEKQQLSSDGKRILSLKIPASTLLQVGASSEFLIGSFSDAEQSSRMTHRKSQDVDDEDEELAVRAEPASTHVYRQNPNNKLIYVDGASKRITIQTAAQVKALGRKAREALEEEQRKRREIVRLERDPEDTGSDHRESGIAFAEAIRKQRPRPSSALKRKHTENFSDAFSHAATGQTDPWAPDVSHVTQCADGERSSFVRLHGLPKGVKPDSIRRFFSGLDVERIFILIPNETRIREWDERKHPSEMLVERHESSFRVYVKFVSSPTADIALARSEEYLYADESDEEKKIGVHIGMTKVPKSTANYLQHNLVILSFVCTATCFTGCMFPHTMCITQAIDGVNGCALDETLAKEAARLGSRVPDLLWTMAMRDLNISLSLLEWSREDETKFPWHHNPTEMDPSDLSGYQQLARHYNALVDEHEEMEKERASLDMKEWDPKHAADGVMRIKRAASDRLLEEIETVKQKLYRAITERRHK